MMDKINCKYCNKEVRIYPYELRNGRKFCSRRCAGKSKIVTDETRKKMSEARRRGLEEGRIKVWNKGLTRETCPILAKTGFQKGHPTYKGCEVTWFKSEDVKGEKNNRWKGGITSLNHQVRCSEKYKNWRTKVFERDKYACQDCKLYGNKLHAHHIKYFNIILKENNIKTFEEALKCKELWVVDNGKTLCIKCHDKMHPEFKNLFKGGNN